MPPLPSDSSDIRTAEHVRCEVRRALAAEARIPPKASVLVGVSGGGDSVALLHLLHELTAGDGTTLAVAHLDHGLRPGDGPREAAFVLDLARRLGIPCHIRRADVAADARALGLGMEETGRLVRYRFFADLRRIGGYDHVALGHHGDDNAEQVLLNLLRGSGPAGLAGIPVRRSNGIVRPLIQLRRKDLAAYRRVGGIAHLTDPSNSDPGPLRNRIRHQLIPHLAQTYNPRIAQGLNRLAGILRDEEEWIDALVAPCLDRCTRSRTTEEIGLDTDRLCRCHPAAQRRIIRAALARIGDGSLKRIGYRHVDAVLDLARPAGSDGRLDLPRRIRVRRRGRLLSLTRMTRPLRESQNPPETGANPFAWACTISAVPLPETGPVVVPLTAIDQCIELQALPFRKIPEFHNAGQTKAFFDMDALSFPMQVRNWRPEDRFIPLGLKSSLRVGRFLENRGLSKEERSRVPVMESGGRIVWVVGHRIDETVRIGPKTRRVLKADIRLV